MLLNGKAETIPQGKITTMLETILEEDLEKLPSPRVLNSHFPLCVLPKQMKGKVSSLSYSKPRSNTHSRRMGALSGRVTFILFLLSTADNSTLRTANRFITNL